MEVLDLALPEKTDVMVRRQLPKRHQELSAGGWRAVGASSGCHSPSSQCLFLTMATQGPLKSLSRWNPLLPPALPKAWPQPCLLDKARNASPGSGLKSLGQMPENSLKISAWMAFTHTVSLPLVAHLWVFGFDFCFLLLENGLLFIERTEGLTSQNFWL